VTNTIFATAYVVLGPGALEGALGRADSFPRAFFFSVHTLSTIGYGHIVPASSAANILMTLESMFGLFGIAITTGLVFARFARPIAKIMFSENAVVAPYRDGRGLMFRIANQRSTQIIELEATVVFSRLVEEDGRSIRRFYELPLERDKVVFFPLAWTIVHPIDKDSPLYELTSEECMRADAEIMVLLKGIDETFSQMVHTRSSFKAREIIWSAKFADIYLREGANIVGIDLGRLSELQQVTAS
jgi:inward rectifier potassium channel